MEDPEYLNDIVVKLLRLPSAKTVTVEIDFDEGELVPGIDLSRLQIVIAEEGVILGGMLELRENIREAAAALSVSPEFPVMPD